MKTADFVTEDIKNIECHHKSSATKPGMKLASICLLVIAKVPLERDGAKSVAAPHHSTSQFGEPILSSYFP